MMFPALVPAPLQRPRRAFPLRRGHRCAFPGRYPILRLALRSAGAKFFGGTGVLYSVGNNAWNTSSPEGGNARNFF